MEVLENSDYKKMYKIKIWNIWPTIPVPGITTFLVCLLPNVSSKPSLCLLCVYKNTIIQTEGIIYAQFRNMLFSLFSN